MRIVLDTNVLMSEFSSPVHSEVRVAPSLREPVCEDSADDKFFACAVAAGCTIIVSGDKHLHRASGYGGIEVLRPRAFVEQYLVQ